MHATRWLAIAACVVVSLTFSNASAQSTTSTSTETKQFEVIAVDGSELVVRTPEGTRQLTVPPDFRFTIDGKPVSVGELKPGMVGTATITTRTTMTPVSVTEVKNGTVVQVSPMSIVVRTDQGVRSFTQSDVDKRGVKILRDGRPAQITDFNPGDYLTATIVTTMPPTTVTERDLQAALARGNTAVSAPAAPDVAQRPAPVEAPPAVENPAPASVPVATTGAQAPDSAQPSTLPKTAGAGPLVGLLGLIAVGIAAGLTARRRRS